MLKIKLVSRSVENLKYLYMKLIIKLLLLLMLVRIIGQRFAYKLWSLTNKWLSYVASGSVARIIIN